MLKEIQAAGPASGSVAAVRRPVLRLEKLSKTFAGDAANAKGTSRQAGRAALLFKLGTKPGYTKCKKL